jgi:hypothetical protein
MIDPESDRLLYSEAVIFDLKQLTTLLSIHPQLPLADISHRMALDEGELRTILRRFGVKHDGLKEPLPRKRSRVGRKPSR